MDKEKLADILFIGGLFVLCIAVLWWGNFYGEIMRGLGGKVSDAFSCLYTSGGACRFASGVAQFVGKTPYNPLVFWIGTVSTCVGGLMKATSKP